MDKKTLLAVGLSIAGLVVYQWWYSKTYLVPAQQSAPAAEARPLEAANPEMEAAALPAPLARSSATPEPPTLAPQSETLSGSRAEYFFSNDAGGIEKVVLLLHLGENEQSVFLNRDRLMPIGALSINPGEAVGGFSLAANEKDGLARFTKTTENGLEITKAFRVPASQEKGQEYVVNLEVSFRNTSQQEITWPDYFVSTGAAAPIHASDMPIYTRFDWYRDGKMSNIDVNWFSPSKIPLVGIQLRDARDLYTETKDQISWAAVTSQYFASIVTAQSPVGNAVWARRFEADRHNGTPVYGIQGALGLPGFTLKPGEIRTQAFAIYAGPKELAALDKLGGGQRAVLNYGMFGLVSEFLLWAMNSLHALTGNYAYAIIILTLIIKTLLWPLQNKATDSMRKMAALSPKMTELRQKYEKDPQKMNEELMKLYREYGVNPFSGCLPLLIQIPIFFGFYTMLGSAIELRNSSFLWVKDLSQPDTIGKIYGFPINLLPIVMAGTMIWQMVITPKTGDKAQQRIFYIMPVIFLVFCYNFASALALYWTTQNIFSIVQLYATRNRPLPELQKKSVVAKQAAKQQSAKKKKQKRSLP